MTAQSTETLTPDEALHHYDADVVVVGGGPAGGWAATWAARHGAKVILVDKGYLGASGVTATAGTNFWLIPPDRERRESAMAQRTSIGGGLVDRAWMERLIEQCWETMPELRGVYAFPTDESGHERLHSLRGPEYGRALRRLVKRAGVEVLDHSPALELLVHADGSVAGIGGMHRQPFGRYQISAPAVVLATGGCAFKSQLLGSHPDTGDGHLMAAEAGVEMTGMEFSCYYTVAPGRSTMTRSMSYLFGTYMDGDGNVIDLPAAPGPRGTALARAFANGRVLTKLEHMPEEIRSEMRDVQPNFMLPFDRAGIDPYTDFFELDLRPEGTIRGTGGIRVSTDEMMTSLPGLFVAGDAASREYVAGAASGGGSVNSAWAMSSGRWAGREAARWARTHRGGRDESARALGGAGLRPTDAVRDLDLRAALSVIQEEVHPVEKNYFRQEGQMRTSVAVLDGVYDEVARHVRGEGLKVLQGRETAAMAAHGRWCYTAALTRQESRGMHRRVDWPKTDPALARRLVTGGLDAAWSRYDDTPIPDAPEFDPAPELKERAS